MSWAYVPTCGYGLKALGTAPDRGFDRTSRRDPSSRAASKRGVRVVPMLREGPPTRALSSFWGRHAAEEPPEALVVRLAGARDRVAAARDHLTPRSDPGRQRVANRLERRRVSAGDHELRERRPGEPPERDLGLPRRALGRHQPRAALEPVRKLGRRRVSRVRTAPE